MGGLGLDCTNTSLGGIAQNVSLYVLVSVRVINVKLYVDIMEVRYYSWATPTHAQLYHICIVDFIRQVITQPPVPGLPLLCAHAHVFKSYVKVKKTWAEIYMYVNLLTRVRKTVH